MFIRADGLTDTDLNAISHSMKSNGSIRVIDISSNRDLSSACIGNALNEILTSNRAIEYFGLSKLNLTTEDVLPMFDLIGRFPFPED